MPRSGLFQPQHNGVIKVYLLDTDHCSRLIGGDTSVITKLKKLGDTRVCTCVIVRGELVFMAERSERKEENLLNVKTFLVDIEIHEIDNDVADTYGRLKEGLLEKFGPKEKKERRKTKLDKIGFKDNDLWIASVALHRGLILVSSDGAFGRIRGASSLKTEKWR